MSVPGPPSSVDLLAVVDSLRSELAEVRARLNSGSTAGGSEVGTDQHSGPGSSSIGQPPSKARPGSSGPIAASNLNVDFSARPKSSSYAGILFPPLGLPWMLLQVILLALNTLVLLNLLWIMEGLKLFLRKVFRTKGKFSGRILW